MYGHVGAQASGSQRSTPGAIFRLFLYSKDFSLACGLLSELDWLTSEIQEATCPNLPNTGIISMHQHTWLSTWVLGIKLPGFRYAGMQVSLELSLSLKMTLNS